MNRIVTFLVAVSAGMHLLVDGLCLCCLYLTASAYGTTQLLNVFLLYNVMAFLSQPLTGMLADKLTHRHWLLLWSVVLLSLGVCVSTVFTLWGVSPVAFLTIAVLLGAGNSLFHVWGGKQAALTTGNDIRALGVFVSTGAFGLAIAMVFFSWTLLCICLLALCLLAAVYLRVDGRQADAAVQGQTATGRTFSLTFIVWAIVVLMVVVGCRSFVGASFSSPVAKSSTVILLIGLVSMLGKMAGGWIVRWMGMVRAVVLMVLAVACCFFLRPVGSVVLLLGLLAVNCTMPVTLYLANVVLKGREGLAFGLLAAALIPGYLLATL